MKTLHYEVSPEVPFVTFQECFALLACERTGLSYNKEDWHGWVLGCLCFLVVAEQPWPYLYVLSGGWIAMIWSCFGGGWIAMTGSCLWWWLDKSHGLVEF